MKKLIALSVALIMVLALVPAISMATGWNLTADKNESGRFINVDTTINLNGHKLTIGSSVSCPGEDATVSGFVVRDGATLTINGPGEVVCSNKRMFCLVKGTINLNGGKYTGDGTNQFINLFGSTTDEANYSTLNMTSAVEVDNFAYGVNVRENWAENKTAKASYGVIANIDGTFNVTSAGIWVLGNIQQDTGNYPIVNIAPSTKINVVTNDGSVDGNALGAAGYAQWNIQGGDFTAPTCFGIKAGIVNIYGGTFTATGDCVPVPDAKNNGIEATGAAISVTTVGAYAGGIELNIKGGSFVSENGNAVYEGIPEEADAPETSSVTDLTISGGQFYTGAEEAKSVLIEDAPAEVVEVTGGAYSTALEIPEGATQAQGLVIDLTKEQLTDNRGSEVTVGVDPTYTVIIPEKVNFGTLAHGNTTAVETGFYVKVQNAYIAEDASISVGVNSDFTMEGSANIEYKLYTKATENATTGGVLVTDSYCIFSYDQGAGCIENATSIVWGYLTCDQSQIKYAGSYSDTMTFTISYIG